RCASPASLVSQDVFWVLVIIAERSPKGADCLQECGLTVNRSGVAVNSFSVRPPWYVECVRVGFILKPDKTAAGVLLEQLVPWLREQGHVAVVPTEDQITPVGCEIVPEEDLGGAVDLAVVLGGDG